MKRFFYAVVALALLATSCAKEEVAKQDGQTEMVTFTITTPQINTRALAEPTGATCLWYAFYDEDKNFLPNISAVDADAPVTVTSNTATIKVSLVKDKDYYVVFWADNGGERPFTFDWKGKTMAIAKQVVGNSNFDGFWNCTPVDTEFTGTITLKRPFAQLNIATADWQKAVNAGVEVKFVNLGLSSAYTQMDLLTGKGITSITEMAFTWAAPVGVTHTFTGNATEYYVLSSNFVFVGTDDQNTDSKMLTDLAINLSEYDTAGESATNIEETLERSCSNVPLQRNYRTWVLGNVVTNEAAGSDGKEFVIVVDPLFGGDDIIENI